MPYSLNLPKKLRVQGWKVKIQEKERLEPPHVTIWRGEEMWRVSLRTKGFLVPPSGSWTDINDEVRKLINDNWEKLCDVRDEKYPSNPVSSTEVDDDAEDSEP